MKSSLRFISRLLVFAFATTLIPAHVLAMEVPRVENPLLNAIRRTIGNHQNIDQDIIDLFNRYQSDDQLKAALLPLAKIPGAGNHFDINDLTRIEKLDQAQLDAEMNQRLVPLNNALAEGEGFLGFAQNAKRFAVRNVLMQRLQAGLGNAQPQPTQEELQAIEAAREREAQATQEAEQARAQEEALAAQIAAQEAQIAAEQARQAEAERVRQAAIVARAQELIARGNRERAEAEAREAAWQERLRARAEAAAREAEAAQVDDANEEAAQAAQEPEVEAVEPEVVVVPELLIQPDIDAQNQAPQEPEVVNLPDINLDAPQAQPVEQVPAAQDPVPAMLDLAPALPDFNQPREEILQPVQQQPAAPVDNTAAERLAALRAQHAAAQEQRAAAQARVQEAERARQAAQAAQAPRVTRPAVPVAQAGLQPGFFDGGLMGMLNNLWERIKANPKTSAAIGIGVAGILYKLISSFMGDDEEDEDDSSDESIDAAPADENQDRQEKQQPARKNKPAKTATTLSPEDAEKSRLQGLKRKRAQLRREFFKNRGRCCKSRCKKRCR